MSVCFTLIWKCETYGMTSTCPIWIRLGLVMLLAAASGSDGRAEAYGDRTKACRRV